jgi:hypothetical protein
MRFDGCRLSGITQFSFILATISRNVHYHDCLVSFAAVKIDYLVLSASLCCNGTLTNYRASSLLYSIVFLIYKLGLLIYFPYKHLLSI